MNNDVDCQHGFGPVGPGIGLQGKAEQCHRSPRGPGAAAKNELQRGGWPVNFFQAAQVPAVIKMPSAAQRLAVSPADKGQDCKKDRSRQRSEERRVGKERRAWWARDE